MSTNQKYHIYLLTVWHEDEEDWRFLLEEPRSGYRRGFSSAAKLIAALLESAASIQPPTHPQDDPDSASSPEC